jgi:hypothetical protein
VQAEMFYQSRGMWFKSVALAHIFKSASDGTDVHPKREQNDCLLKLSWSRCEYSRDHTTTSLMTVIASRHGKSNRCLQAVLTTCHVLKRLAFCPSYGIISGTTFQLSSNRLYRWVSPRSGQWNYPTSKSSAINRVVSNHPLPR